MTEEQIDDAAVDSFAAVMKEKMAASRAKGRHGWHDENMCDVEELIDKLYEHLEWPCLEYPVDKNNLVDIANFAMMIHSRLEKSAPAAADKPA